MKKIVFLLLLSINANAFAQTGTLSITLENVKQPVVYEFPLLKVPTVLFIGTVDKTSVGKGALSREDQQKYGQYRILGKTTAAKIKGSKLIEFPKVGYIPHLQVPDAFLKALIANVD